MTTLQPERVVGPPAGRPTPAPTRPEAASGARWRAGAVIGCHTVIDAFSFVIIAMLPALVIMLEIPPQQKALLLGLGSVASGLVQPIVAWISDRFDTRLPGYLGFAVAVLAISNVGHAHTVGQLAALFALGAMGVGAFHPPAAASVGTLAGKKRARMLAVFFLAGMIGGMAGNVFTPRYVAYFAHTGVGIDTRAGLLALRWMMIPGLIACAVLAVAVRKVGHRAHGAHDTHASWSRDERRARWRAVWLLYASNVLRFGVNMALVYLFTEWATRHTAATLGAAASPDAIGARASSLNGMLQACMQVGMGGGGMLLGYLLGPRLEKTAFWLIPMLGALAVAALTQADHAPMGARVLLAMTGSVLAGFGFGSCVPMSLSLAARMLPHRTSLACGLMLGGAWAFAFTGPLLAELVQNGLRAKPSAPPWLLDLAGSLPGPVSRGLLDGMGLDAGFFFAAGMLVIAGAITLALPGSLLRRTHAD